MATQSAIVVQEPGRAVLRKDAAIPELPENYILVKTKAGMLFEFHSSYDPYVMYELID